MHEKDYRPERSQHMGHAPYIGIDARLPGLVPNKGVEPLNTTCHIMLVTTTSGIVIYNLYKPRIPCTIFQRAASERGWPRFPGYGCL